jgi:hypothetical protein
VRVGILALLLLSTAAVAGCYQQPLVPRDKPLRCTSLEEGECPTGFRCIASGVCALIDCRTDDDCTEGLVCDQQAGCDLPEPDGGSEAGSNVTDGGAQGGLLPGVGDALDLRLPDAPLGVGTPPILDGPPPILDGPQGGS